MIEYLENIFQKIDLHIQLLTIIWPWMYRSYEFECFDTNDNYFWLYLKRYLKLRCFVHKYNVFINKILWSSYLQSALIIVGDIGPNLHHILKCNYYQLASPHSTPEFLSEFDRINYTFKSLLSYPNQIFQIIQQNVLIPLLFLLSSPPETFISFVFFNLNLWGGTSQTFSWFGNFTLPP